MHWARKEWQQCMDPFGCRTISNTWLCS